MLSAFIKGELTHHSNFDRYPQAHTVASFQRFVMSSNTATTHFSSVAILFMRMAAETLQKSAY